MNRTFQELLEARLDALALTLQRNSIKDYRGASRRFLAYLHTAFPQVCYPSQLRRDPHLLGWFRALCDRQPPLSNTTRRDYLIAVRRLLNDLALDGHPIAPDLIRTADLPREPRNLITLLQTKNDEKLAGQLANIPRFSPSRCTRRTRVGVANSTG